MNEWDDIYEEEEEEDYHFCPCCGCEMILTPTEAGDGEYVCHCGYTEGY